MIRSYRNLPSHLRELDLESCSRCPLGTNSDLSLEDLPQTPIIIRVQDINGIQRRSHILNGDTHQERKLDVEFHHAVLSVYWLTVDMAFDARKVASEIGDGIQYP